MMRRCLALAAALLAVLPLSACQKALEPAQFVGRWKSSRATSPMVLTQTGEWELRGEDGALLQYGVWHLEGRQLVWTVRDGDRVTHDPTLVLSVEPRSFSLRERDGSTTQFQRLDGAP